MTIKGIPQRKTLITLALALATSGALAQDSGWYGGATFGRAWADIDNGAVGAAAQAAGTPVNNFYGNDADNAWKILGGYNINKNFAVEGSWFDLGEFGYSSNLLPSGGARGNAELEGYALDLVGKVPLAERLSFLARVGVNNTKIKQSFNNTLGGAFTNDSDRDWYGHYGIGLQYALTDRWDLRTEVTRYEIDDISFADDGIDLFSVGVNYRFGAKPAPAPVAAPAPAPQPAPEPAPAPLMEVTLGAEALFDFDKAELKPEGRARLDQLLRDMQPLNYDSVVIIGHTDRIGTRDYNISLSTRRANAVRDYLVQGGVAAARVTARGVNSDQPVTTPEQCAGRRGDALIACYQPDRRVVIEVHGTRQGQ
jgi:OOP family OmpA-OmpF porin